jgi:hypothetical protein
MARKLVAKFKEHEQYELERHFAARDAAQREAQAMMAAAQLMMNGKAEALTDYVRYLARVHGVEDAPEVLLERIAPLRNGFTIRPRRVKPARKDPGKAAEDEK